MHSGHAPSSRWSVPCTQHPPCLHQAWRGVVGKRRRLAERPWGEGAPAIHVTLRQAWRQVSLQKTQVVQ